MYTYACHNRTVDCICAWACTLARSAKYQLEPCLLGHQTDMVMFCKPSNQRPNMWLRTATLSMSAGVPALANFHAMVSSCHLRCLAHIAVRVDAQTETMNQKHHVAVNSCRPATNVEHAGLLACVAAGKKCGPVFGVIMRCAAGLLRKLATDI